MMRSLLDRWARRRLKRGVKLFSKGHCQSAVREWEAALTRLTDADDRYLALDYLAKAYGDAGHFREASSYSERQLSLIPTLDDPRRHQATLSIALAQTRLANYHKCLELLTDTTTTSNNGNKGVKCRYSTILCETHVEMGNFQEALLLSQVDDVTLCKAYALAGAHYQAVGFGLRALRALEGPFKDYMDITQLHSRINNRETRFVLLYLSLALRKLRRHGDAFRCARDAFAISVACGDAYAQGRALVNLGDVYRVSGDLQRAMIAYRVSIHLTDKISDRLGVAMSLSGAATTMLLLKRSSCSCGALELLKMAEEMAVDLHASRFHFTSVKRLARAYDILGDNEAKERFEEEGRKLMEEMNLVCFVCGEDLDGDVVDVSENGLKHQCCSEDLEAFLLRQPIQCYPWLPPPEGFDPEWR